MNDAAKPPVESSQPEAVTRARSVQLGKVFWGLLLILIGSLFLLDNFNVIDVAFGNVWRLWPLLLVAAGASMLSLRGWLGVSIATALGACMLFFVLAVALGWLHPDSRSTATTKSVDIRQSSEQIRQASIMVSGGAGQIDIGSTNTVSLIKARLQSNFTQLSQQSTVRGDTQYVSITLDSGDSWWRGNYKNDLFVTLNESLPMSLKVDAGASSIQGDLSRVTLKRLELDSGASDIDLKIGAKSDTTGVQIDVGMSSVTLSVPKTSGVSLRIDSGMSSKDTSGLREVSKGYFESDNYSTATHKVDIRGNIGMSNLDLNYY